MPLGQRPGIINGRFILISLSGYAVSLERGSTVPPTLPFRKYFSPRVICTEKKSSLYRTAGSVYQHLLASLGPYFLNKK